MKLGKLLGGKKGGGLSGLLGGSKGGGGVSGLLGGQKAGKSGGGGKAEMLQAVLSLLQGAKS